MAIKVSSLGQTVLVKKVGTSTNTFVKKIVVGTPTGRFVTSSSVSLDALTDVSAANPSDGDILSYDSTSGEWINTTFTVKLDAAGLGGTGLTYDSATDTLHIDSAEFASFYLNKISGNLIPSVDSTYDLGDSTHKWRSLYISGNTINLGGLKLQDVSDQFQVLNSTGNPAPIDLSGNTTDNLAEGIDNLYYTTARVQNDITDLGVATNIRELFTASGDLSYDNATGEFSFDVEQVYTKANFDSDFNMSIDEAALNGTGLSYDSSTNTLSITDTGVVSGTYGSTTQVPVFTVNAQGQIDSVGEVLVAGVTSTTYDSATGIFTINTADGNSFATTFHDSDDRIAEIRGAVSASGDLSYDVNTGVFSFDVEQVYTKSNFDSDLNQALDEAALGGTGLTYDSSTNTLSITVTGVVAGTYGSTTQVPVFTVNAQGQIDSIGEVLVAGVTSTTYDSATGVFTINTADGGSFATTLHDSDDRIAEIRSALSASGDLTYNSSTGQFSFDVESVYTKANFDSDLSLALSTDAVTTTDLTEGNNLYYTTARADSDFDVRLATKSTTDLAEGDNLYYTTDRADSDAKKAVSVTDAGGDGSLTYSNITGVFTYTGPSASEVRAHFSAGTGVNIASGVVSIGQPVATTSDVTFAKITGDSAIVDGINLNQTPTQYSTTPGALYFDSNELHGLTFVPRTREGATDNKIRLGQQQVIYAHNQTGETVNRGDVVYISGTAHGSHPKISKAQANNSTIGTIALASTDIVDNAHGYVTRFGLVDGLNTDGLVAGDDVYLSKDSAGKWTTTEVSIDSGYPIHIGKIVAVDASEGTILVDPFTEHFEYLRIEDRLLVTGKIEGDSASISQIDFNTLYAEHIPYKEGSVWYDQIHKTLNYWGDDSNVVHEIGIEEHQRVYNNTGSTILKGKPLYFSGNYNPGGSEVAVPTVGLADATDVNAYNAQGLAASDIPDNSYGYCLISGQLDNVNTQGLSADTNFFVGLTPGAVQNASPTYPNYPMCLGWVVKADSADGVLLVNQQNHSVNSFRVRTTAHIGSDLIVGGNLTVTGTQTITSTENVQIGGNIQYLNAGNTIGEANTTFVGSGLDDAFFAGHYSGDSSTKSFYVKIDSAGATDTFEWGHDSTFGPIATGIAITGAEQTLTTGIKIDFGAITGHTLGDKWTGTAAATDTDTGIFSNRNTGDAGDGYTHLGFFFDVSENKWRLLDAYDSEPEAPINITSPSLSYGTLVLDTVEGNLTGDVTGNADTATQLANNRAFSITGDITATGVNFNGTGNVALNAAITSGSIVNDDINASAAIADTKLATISTAGKVQNGATTATDANTASAIVARDASGNFQAGTITATTVLSDNFKHSKSTTNSDFKVSFTDTTITQSGNFKHQISGTSGFTYNPSTDTLTVGTLSGNASSADSAYHALSADSATTAASALFATNATNATYADSATSAASAIFATNATNATYADSATTAASALFATNATNADSATNATTALVATNSTYADSATTAASALFATNATYADSATNAGQLNSQTAAYYLNYNNFTNTPTDVSTFVNDANYLDSTTVQGVVDTHLNQSNPIDGYVLSWTSGDYAWVAQSGGGGASVTTSASAPGSPSDGDLWFDETSTSLFLYYQDSDTSQWVQVGGGGGGGGSSSLSNIADSGTGVRISGDLIADSDGIFAGDVTAANFNTTSDARLKTNVRTIYDALDKTMQLRGVYFDKNGKPDIGLIAQEVEEVMPMAVNTLNDEMQTKTVNYGGLVGLLIQSIKNQQEQIDELNNKINRLME